jgi:hypothetical protein
VQVLKAGAVSSGGLGGASNPQSQSSTVTLNVPDSDVGAIAFSAEYGKVWLVLRPANAKASPAPPAVNVQSLLAKEIVGKIKEGNSTGSVAGSLK